MNATTNADTLFIPLCSVPCNLTISDMSGNTCICSTGTVTTVGDKDKVLPRVKISPSVILSGQNLNLQVDSGYTEIMASIFNISGQKIYEQVLSNASSETIQVSIDSAVPGEYVLLVTDKKSWRELIKFVIQ